MHRRACKRYRYTPRHRGTAYVLVLSITTMLVMLGIAATHLARGQIETGQREHDQARTRLAAEYAQDYAHKLIHGSTTWRENVPNDAWRDLFVIDGVQLSFKCVDEIDGVLANDYTQPFRLYTRAASGIAVRIYSAEYIPDASGGLKRNPSSWRQEIVVE